MASGQFLVIGSLAAIISWQFSVASETYERNGSAIETQNQEPETEN